MVSPNLSSKDVMHMYKTWSQTLQVASYQTDINARLRPGAVLELMQEIAGVHAELLGVGRTHLLPRGLAWVLTRVEVRMDRYPASGETITVETFPMPNRRVFFPRYFIFRDADGQQIGCAGSLWAVLDIATRKMASATEIAALMPDNRDLTAPMGTPATVEEVSAAPLLADHLPVYTDLDMNGHVNNTRYLDWCCNALSVETMKTHTLTRFAVNYHQEILPGQTVRTELRRNANDFSFSGFEGDKRHFDVGGALSPL